MEPNSPIKVLILCTGNSARSILAEYILRAKGKGRFDVHSAGSNPTGRVNPLAIRTLREKYGLAADEARSKSWNEFRNVKFDLVITVCDHAKETCPVWPGQPVIAHWSSPDPAALDGSEEKKFQGFIAVASQIARRADLLCALPGLTRLDAGAIRDIGGQFVLPGEPGVKK
jgi:arsenate reductase (thioredoxin)